jgi:dienelactone hydrolase
MTQARQVPIEVVHEGTTLRGMATVPDGAGPYPAVLMFPGATGPGPSFRRTIQELGSLGYFTVEIDMYGSDADIGTPHAAGAHFEALLNAPERLRARVVAWFEQVCAQPQVDAARVSAIGYCFGGKCVLELARSGAPVRSVTSFHGLLRTHDPMRKGAFAGHIAVWTGGRDPYAPLADFAELRAEFDAAAVDYQATLFATAQHSFTDPDHHGFAEGIAYDPLSHRTAWAGTLALLQHALH